MTDKRADDRRDTAGIPMNTSKTSDRVKSEVKKIIEADRALQKDMLAELLERYSKDPDTVDRITRMYEKHIARINEKVRKVAEKVYAKYATSNRPSHEIYAKVLRFRDRLGWTDAEFTEFYRHFASLSRGRRAEEISLLQNMYTERSAINRLIGEERVVRKPTAMKVDVKDQAAFAEIIRLRQETQRFQEHFALQSRIYQDCSQIAIGGIYDKDKHISYKFIPAYLFALFVPRFEILENQILRSDFGRIVQARSNGESVYSGPATLGDYELFQNITVDPMDAVCDVESPMSDLLHRYKVQIAAKEAIAHLRGGNYYAAANASTDPGSVLQAHLARCRDNLYDVAGDDIEDEMYGTEGPDAIRRFLNTFSVRPLVVVSSAVPQHVALTAGLQAAAINVVGNRYRSDTGRAIYPFNDAPVNTLTRVPMVTLNLTSSSHDEPLNLTKALDQVHWLNHRGVVTPHRFQILSCDGILMINVRRIQYSRKFQTYLNPVAFMRTPISVQSKYYINATPIVVPHAFRIDPDNTSSDVVILRSVLAHRYVQYETENGADLTIDKEERVDINSGFCALVTKNDVFGSDHYIYDPVGATIPIRNADGSYFMNKPVSIISQSSAFTQSDSDVSFDAFACRRGVFFVYQKEKN
jgi:hypothetical protein